MRGNKKPVYRSSVTRCTHKHTHITRSVQSVYFYPFYDIRCLLLNHVTCTFGTHLHSYLRRQFGRPLRRVVVNMCVCVMNRSILLLSSHVSEFSEPTRAGERLPTHVAIIVDQIHIVRTNKAEYSEEDKERNAIYVRLHGGNIF